MPHSEIKKAEALIAAGTPRANVYAKATEKGQTKVVAPKPQAAPEDNKVYNVEVKPGDAIKGNPNAAVTIVEFSDFQCPFCSRVNPTLKQVFDTYGDQVRVVFKHNPLSFHKDAPLASEAALAAGAQGKFWEMHDKLFANQRALKRENLDAYAMELGLNVAQFKADLDSHKFKAQVDADLAQAAKLGVRGTPNFFVNGKKLTGARPFPSFKEKIDEALKGGKKAAVKVPVNKAPIKVVPAPVKVAPVKAAPVKAAPAPVKVAPTPKVVPAPVKPAPAPAPAPAQ